MDLRKEDSLKEKEVVQIQIKGGTFKWVELNLKFY
jgi:hypothetical protein